MSPLLFLLCSSLLLLHQNSHSLRIPDSNWNHLNHLRTTADDHASHIEPDFTVFFHYKRFKPGHTMPIYFPPHLPSTAPRLLPRPQTNSFPFSLSQFPQILSLFSFPLGSKQSEAIKNTLSACDLPPIEDSGKFCAGSQESMLESVAEILGQDSGFEAVRTRYLTESVSVLQNYTISEAPREMAGKMSVACHLLPYPYAVYYCHGQYSDLNRIYKVMLAGEDGGRVEALAVCHMDTSSWDPSNPAFGVLDTVPGALPVCHFFPPDNLVWVPLS